MFFSYLLFHSIEADISCDEIKDMEIPMQQFDFIIKPNLNYCIQTKSKSAFFIFNKRKDVTIRAFISPVLNEIGTEFQLPVDPTSIVGFSFGFHYYGTLLFTSNLQDNDVEISLTGNMLYLSSASLFITNANNATWTFPNSCQYPNDGKYYRYYLNMGMNDAKYEIDTHFKSMDEYIEITDKDDALVERIYSENSSTIESFKTNSYQFLFYSKNKETKSNIVMHASTSLEPEIPISGCFSTNGPKWILNTSFIQNQNEIPETKDHQTIIFIIVGIVLAVLFVLFAAASVFYYIYKKQE